MLDSEMEILYKKYYKDLYIYAFSLCKNYHLAQDLASDTFYKALLSFNDSEAYIKFWLFRVCKNLFLDYIRKNKNEYPSKLLDKTLVNEDTPLDSLISSEERKYLNRMIMELPDAYREVTILYYYCDFTIEEITKSTGLTNSNIKVLLFRSRKKLKLKLEGGK